MFKGCTNGAENSALPSQE